MNAPVVVPKLDIDARLYPHNDGVPSAQGIRERRIVANLIAHIEAAGFVVADVDDGEELESVSTMKEAMELIFNLDVAYLFVRKPGTTGSDHSITLVLGNDLDIVSDWSFSKGDADGFNAAMEQFDVEKFA